MLDRLATRPTARLATYRASQAFRPGMALPGARVRVRISVVDVVRLGGHWSLRGAVHILFSVTTPCDTSQAPVNGNKGNCSNSLLTGTSCQPSCDQGYVASGPSTCYEFGLAATTCTRTCAWPFLHFSCTVLSTCRLLLSVYSGAVSSCSFGHGSGMRQL